MVKAATGGTLFKENENRFVVFPIEHHGIWEFYKKAIASFWTPEEIKLSDDLNDWEELSENEKHFIKNVLAFFAASDGIVNENLGERFLCEVQLTEAKCFYGFQIAIENIHSETYSLLIDTYIKDPTEKDKLLNAITTIPCVATKADWALKWIDSQESYAHRLVAFACVEGIFFSGSFCAIFWIKKQGKMPGLCFSNELISRDEGLHCDFACYLYSNYIDDNDKLSQDEINSIVSEAVSIEKEFILESLPCKLIGMNSDLMSQYIEFVADRILSQLGHSKIWNSENPFDFMEQQGMEIKANFFENRVSAYSKAGVGVSRAEMEFDTDTAF